VDPRSGLEAVVRETPSPRRESKPDNPVYNLNNTGQDRFV